ncbi:MAG: Nramp family divalent metal transporter [Cyclobacteriaceae bacterium]|nr:Nramp family divalent metal transporter [Cyclobacteriaceae bacterium]
MSEDPYILTPENIKEPPTAFRGRLRYLGPSFILSASIVGSGELIATTTLGAKAGFVTFWVVIVSCLVKVMVQLEMGKHTILSGESAMKAFSALPGPQWGGSRWSVWLVLLIQSVKLLQLGGIVGGVAIILNMIWPQIPLVVAVFVVVIVVALLVFKGYYGSIEKISLVLIAFFTIFTFTALYFLTYTDYALTWDSIASGLRFQLPVAAVAVVFGAFGITGVGGDEIIHYNYWCLEKGYAAHTGPNDGSPEWQQRARGWIKVMHLDALLAMVIYTMVTAAFYLLGAAVLHVQGRVPEGYEVIESLSNMYTASLGPNAKPWFLLGSFVVLFSTLFAALAALTRQYSDIFGQLGWIDFLDLRQRKRSIAILAWALPLLWAIMFLFMKLPVLMVIIGGIMGSILLLLVVIATLHFRYWRTEAAFKPKLVYDLVLWLSVASISMVALYGFIQLSNH